MTMRKKTVKADAPRATTRTRASAPRAAKRTPPAKSSTPHADARAATRAQVKAERPTVMSEPKVRAALEAARGRIKTAAANLGVPRTSLDYAVKTHGLREFATQLRGRSKFGRPFQDDLTPAEALALLREHGSVAAACKAYGCHATKFRDRIALAAAPDLGREGIDLAAWLKRERAAWREGLADERAEVIELERKQVEVVERKQRERVAQGKPAPAARKGKRGAPLLARH
jgi:hypothetical protein